MIAEINNSWNWKGFTAIEVIRTNEFGNIIFKTDKNEYWRLCPEEISCEKVANNESEFIKISSASEFIEDWEMTNLVKIAKGQLGELEHDQKYCLKLAAVIGGQYEKSNLGKISFSKLISLSGDLGFQIKDLKDGQKIKMEVKHLKN